MSEFLKALQERVLIGDGALGTQIYGKGVPLGHCYDELNLTKPHLIKVIHREYLDAGADILLTNTFTANRLRLKQHQLESKVHQINLSGARLAREVAGTNRFVVGSIGPITGVKHEEEELSVDEKFDVFAEQARALGEGGCDAISLETFTDLDELKIALRAVKEETKLPCSCLLAFVFKMKTPFGVGPQKAVKALEVAGADVIGANCTTPHWTSKVIERMGASTKVNLSAYPNAGMPEYREGRYMYLTTPDYFAEMSLKMVNAGANLVGGCCGTGPEHIRAVADRLQGSRPRPRIISFKPHTAVTKKSSSPAQPRSKGFLDKIQKKKPIVVELDPPRGLKFEKLVKGAKKLHKLGVDAITVGDNPLAVMRMGHLALAHFLEREGVPTILHISCRDRNLIGLQSTILEAAAFGIESLLPITGDPAKVGDQPGATSVYDLNSFGLIELIAKMNEGKSYSGNSIQKATNFSIGVAFNPNVKDVDRQVRRLQKKIDAGAEYALPQPCYDIEKIPAMYESIRAGVGDFPVFFGVCPLVSAKNAEFLAHEVPGITIPEPVIERMRSTPEEKQREEGIRISQELIDAALDYAPGFYIVPPFGSIELSTLLTRYIQKRLAEQTAASA